VCEIEQDRRWRAAVRVLHENGRDGDDHGHQQNRDQGFGITGKIEFEHVRLRFLVG